MNTTSDISRKRRRQRKARLRAAGEGAIAVRPGSLSDLAERALPRLARKLSGGFFIRRQLAEALLSLADGRGTYGEMGVERVSHSLTNAIDVLLARGKIFLARPSHCRAPALYGVGPRPANFQLLPIPRTPAFVPEEAKGSGAAPAPRRATHEDYEQRRLLEHRARRLAQQQREERRR